MAIHYLNKDEILSFGTKIYFDNNGKYYSGEYLILKFPDVHCWEIQDIHSHECFAAIKMQKLFTSYGIAYKQSSNK